MNNHEQGRTQTDFFKTMYDILPYSLLAPREVAEALDSGKIAGDLEMFTFWCILSLNIVLRWCLLVQSIRHKNYVFLESIEELLNSNNLLPTKTFVRKYDNKQYMHLLLYCFISTKTEKMPDYYDVELFLTMYIVMS